MSVSIIPCMKESSRRYINAVLIFAIIFAMFHIIPSPIDGAGSFGGFVAKEAVNGVKELLKKGNVVIGILTGKFDRIHKSVEHAVDWIKDNKYNLAASSATTVAVDVVYDASTHVTTFTDGGYSVDFVPDDDNEQFNIYVNDESCAKLAYENLENCSGERISEEFAHMKKNAIREYKSRHR